MASQLDYRRAALGYLVDWIWYDRPFHSTLAFDNQASISPAEGAVSLAEAARHCGVNRTLKKIESEKVRLESAFIALSSVRSIDPASVVDEVNGWPKDFRKYIKEAFQFLLPRSSSG